jgi:hypothetical protein
VTQVQAVGAQVREPMATVGGGWRAVGGWSTARWMQVDAALDVVMGVTALALAGPLTRALGVGTPGWSRIVGAVLLVCAVEFALVARSDRWRRAGARTVGVADLVFAAGLVAWMPFAGLRAGGAVIVAVVAVDLAVLGFGLLRSTRR